MATRLSVVNQALTFMGQALVASLEQDALDASNAAKTVLLVLDDARDEVLGRTAWTCNTEFVSLTASPGTVDDDWRYPYRFPLPGDCLGLWTVDFGSSGRSPWTYGTADEAGGGVKRFVKCASAGPLHVAYKRRCSWEAMSPHIASAIAQLAAARAAGPVTGNLQDVAYRENKAEQRVLLAISIDGTNAGDDNPQPLASGMADIRAAGL